jgi:hypothetical protein
MVRGENGMSPKTSLVLTEDGHVLIDLERLIDGNRRKTRKIKDIEIHLKITDTYVLQYGVTLPVILWTRFASITCVTHYTHPFLFSYSLFSLLPISIITDCSSAMVIIFSLSHRLAL